MPRIGDYVRTMGGRIELLQAVLFPLFLISLVIWAGFPNFHFSKYLSFVIGFLSVVSVMFSFIIWILRPVSKSSAKQ